MIRFIDLRGQDTGYRFAFYDTVVDKFVDIDGDQAWDTWADVLASCRGEDISPSTVGRFFNVTPDWATKA